MSLATCPASPMHGSATPAAHAGTHPTLHAQGGRAPAWRLAVCAAWCSLLTLLVTALPARAGERFLSLDAAMGEALQGAGREQKLVLAVFGTESCWACREMKSTTLSEDAWKAFPQPPLLVEIDANAERATAQAFGIRVIPALFLLTGEGKVVATAEGYHDTAALQALVEMARTRLAHGEWEGQAADRSEAGEAVETPQRLVESLAAPDAPLRESAARMLLAHREEAMPALLEGLSHPYLGVRVGCADLIHRLAPEAPEVDPWLPKSDREAGAVLLAGWWERTGTLPPPAAVPPSPARDRDIEAALAALDSRNPLERTRGMARLAHHGQVVLPELARVRERAIRAENHVLLNLVEDVRWALLVPPSLEGKARVRVILARGESRDRQEATLRLSQAGVEALPALVALSQDEDTLVREQSIHALRRLGSPAAMEALAGLLGSGEANLRMVAAQVIGETRNAAHAGLLQLVLTDPDEVVATTAIAAFGALRPRGEWERLRPAAEDPRWRIRAAAAEVLGSLADDGHVLLMPLLEDEDAFVVHAALQSLRRMRKLPPERELQALLQRNPSLVEVILQHLLRDDEKKNLLFAAKMLDTLEPPHVEAVLDVLAGLENTRHTEDGHWVPVFRRLLQSDDPAIRLRAVHMLELRSAPLARRYVGHFLSDADPEVRRKAAQVVISTLAFGFGLEGESHAEGYGTLLKTGIPTAHPTWVEHLRNDPTDSAAYRRDLNMTLPPPPAPPQPTAPEPGEDTPQVAGTNPFRWLWGSGGTSAETPEPSVPQPPSRPSRLDPQTREAHFIAAHMEDCHARLSTSPDRETDPATLWAWYLTGDGVNGLEEILAWIKDPANEPARRELGENRVIGLLLARGVQQDTLSMFDALLADPVWYPALYAFPGLPGMGGLQERIHDPQRLLAYLATAESSRVQALLETLLQGADNPASIFHPQRGNLREALRTSSHPLARALGVYTLLPLDVDSVPETLAPFLADPDPWVRHAAVQRTIHLLRQHQEREPLLLSRLGDPRPETALLAAMGLLQDAYWDIFHDRAFLGTFMYEGGRVHAGHAPVRHSRGTPVSLSATPEVLGELRTLYQGLQELREEGGGTDADAQAVPILLLVLAQYGDTGFIGPEIQGFLESDGRDPRMRRTLLFVARHHPEPETVAFIRQTMEKETSIWRLRQLLSSIPNVPTPEVRALRREVNAKIREMQRRPAESSGIY